MRPGEQNQPAESFSGTGDGCMIMRFSKPRKRFQVIFFPWFGSKRKGRFTRCQMKGKLLLVPFVLGAGLLAVCGSALAHHGNVAYADKVVEFKQATVTKFLWSNPHSLIEFDVKDEKGNVVHWTAETASPEALKLIGWS